MNVNVKNFDPPQIEIESDEEKIPKKKANAFKTKVKPQRPLHSTWGFSFIILSFEFGEEKISGKATTFKMEMKSIFCVEIKSLIFLLFTMCNEKWKTRTVYVE